MNPYYQTVMETFFLTAIQSSQYRQLPDEQITGGRLNPSSTVSSAKAGLARQPQGGPRPQRPEGAGQIAS